MSLFLLRHRQGRRRRSRRRSRRRRWLDIKLTRIVKSTLVCNGYSSVIMSSSLFNTLVRKFPLSRHVFGNNGDMGEILTLEEKKEIVYFFKRITTPDELTTVLAYFRGQMNRIDYDTDEYIWMTSKVMKFRNETTEEISRYHAAMSPLGSKPWTTLFDRRNNDNYGNEYERFYFTSMLTVLITLETGRSAPWASIRYHCFVHCVNKLYGATRMLYANHTTDDECPICFSKTVYKSKCNHPICETCFRGLDTPPICPLCRRSLVGGIDFERLYNFYNFIIKQTFIDPLDDDIFSFDYYRRAIPNAPIVV